MRHYIKYIVVLILWFDSGTLFSQEGEQLFKAKCNTCHYLDREGIGPKLQGVKEKWMDAGEEELLYEWVKNSGELISLGKSKMAIEIKDFNRLNMPPQSISNEEIDAIFGFVDGWAIHVDDSSEYSTNEALHFSEEYSSNLTLFYAMMGMAIFLLFAIVVFATSIKNFLQADNTKNGILRQVLLLVIGTSFSIKSANAFEFVHPGTSESGTPWLLVNSLDLSLLLIFNVLLVLVLLYLKGILKRLMSQQKSET